MKRIMALLVVVLFACSVVLLIAADINTVHAAKIRIVSGKVTAIYPIFGSKGSLTISSNQKIYTIYTGVKTNFHPPRWPIVGDWVRVRYIIDREGYYRAYDIYID
ncbi:MAG TPA: hypothetical protein ENN35_08775 [Deltaproteobacteria bacterium]|nr:hypothetical protein [Deltaproteobacteria bacterium]